MQATLSGVATTASCSTRHRTKLIVHTSFGSMSWVQEERQTCLSRSHAPHGTGDTDSSRHTLRSNSRRWGSRPQSLMTQDECTRPASLHLPVGETLGSMPTQHAVVKLLFENKLLCKFVYRFLPHGDAPKEVKARTADGGRSSTGSHARSVGSGHHHYASPCLAAGSPPYRLTVCGPRNGSAALAWRPQGRRSVPLPLSSRTVWRTPARHRLKEAGPDTVQGGHPRCPPLT